jgi:hypothetical protein
MEDNIKILYRSVPIISGLQQQILTNIHYQPLQNKLIKDTGWDSSLFLDIDWGSYLKAIKSFPRSHRISIAKLSYKLWNTNAQNKKFYSEPGSCPICQTKEETVEHLFTCSANQAREDRDKALDTYTKTLTKAGTSDTLLQHLKYMLLLDTGTLDKQPPESTDEIQEAINRQTKIGWKHFIKGFISLSWGSLYATFLPKKQRPKPKAKHGQSNLSPQTGHVRKQSGNFGSP